MKEGFDFRNKYLKKKLEKPGEITEGEVDLLSKMQTPLVEIKYWNNDEFEIKKGDLSFKIKYGKDGLEEVAEIFAKIRVEDENRKSKIKRTEEVVSERKEDIKNRVMEEYVRLEKYELDNGVEKMDLLGIFPSNYKDRIIFKYDPSNFNGEIHLGPDFVEITGNLLAPETVMTILHEAGHAWSNVEDEIETFDKYDAGEGVSEKEGEVILREERNANAFALRAIGPFKKSFQINNRDLAVSVHAASLKGHSAEIVDLIKKFKDKRKLENRANDELKQLERPGAPISRIDLSEVDDIEGIEDLLDEIDKMEAQREELF